MALGVGEGVEIDTSPAWAFGTRFGVAPIGVFEIGSSFAMGMNASDEDEMVLWGTDVQSSFFNFELKGEYIFHSYNRSLEQTNDRGYYFQATYNIVDRAFVTSRYGSFKPDGNDWIGQFSLGGGYSIFEGVQLRLETLIAENSEDNQNYLQLVAGF